MNSAAGSWVCAEQSSEMPSDVRHTRPRHRSDIPLRSLQAGSGLTDGDSDAPSGGGKITRSMNFARALWRALTPDQGRQPYFASPVRSLGKPQLGQLLSVYVCPASPNGNRLFCDSGFARSSDGAGQGEPQVGQPGSRRFPTSCFGFRTPDRRDCRGRRNERHSRHRGAGCNHASEDQTRPSEGYRRAATPAS